MKLKQYFLFIIIPVISILNINAGIPFTHARLHVNGRNVNQACIAISDDTRFVVGISTDEYLHFWDLFQGNNAIINLDIAFDEHVISIDNLVICDIFDDDTVLIGIKAMCCSNEDRDIRISKIKVIHYN